MTTATEPATETSIRDIAVEICRSQSDIDAAIDALVDRLNGDPAIREWAVRKAAQETIYEVRASMTARTKAVLGGWKPSRTGGIDALNEAIEASIFESWYIGNIPLGDATGDVLVEESQREHELSEGHRKVSLFFASLAKRVKPGKTVRESLSEKQVGNLWKKLA